MRAIDTNLLVRLVVRDDDRQLENAEKFVSRGAWVSTLVLAETIWVLDAVYERSANQLAAAVGMLLTHSELTLQDGDSVSAALKDYRAHPSVGFSDCLILATARKAGHLPLGTLHRQLGKLAGAQYVKN